MSDQPTSAESSNGILLAYPQISKLISAGVITSEELSHVSVHRLTELNEEVANILRSPNPRAKIEGNFLSPPQGVENVKAFEEKLKPASQAILESVRTRLGDTVAQKVLAILYFGSRLNPDKSPRDDSDLDMVIILADFTTEEIQDEIDKITKKVISDSLHLKAEVHAKIDIHYLSLIPEILDDVGVKAGKSFVFCDAKIMSQLAPHIT